MSRAGRFLVGGLSTTLLCAFGVPAQADWLAGPSRAISIADSASPNAPVTGHEYGPRAKASLGGDLALYAVRTLPSSFRFGGSALLAFEDADNHALFPSQTMRSDVELSAAWAGASLRSASELALTLGRQSASTVADFVLRDRYHSNDIPFGGGGYFLGGDATLAWRVGSRLELRVRAGLRLYTNAFPDLVRARVASDAVADALHEGAECAFWGDFGLRFHALPRLDPLARLYFDFVSPHDDSAASANRWRLLIGAAIIGDDFELTPFTALEVGNGQGVLINREELRWSVGTRLYAR